MGAYTWWLDDVMMDEGDRLKKKIHRRPKRSSGGIRRCSFFACSIS